MKARATYRMQLHAGFTFDDAARQIDYLQRLGITDIYASPILRARAGSRHGYDVVDPDTVNPELGGVDGLRRLSRRLHDAGMGLIVDIVPNHMAVGAENAIWMDVLEKGVASAYSAFFDIDWTPADLSLVGKVLLPVLGEPYRQILTSGSLTLVREADRVMLHYGDHRLPLRIADSTALMREPYATLQTIAKNADTLDELLSRQHYRLAWWRTAGDRINWRRFFDINELVAVQVERPEVFDIVHGAILRFYAEGVIDGLRVDHVDGLTDPAAYCQQLRDRLNALDAKRPADAIPGPALLVVEKILGMGERLPASWGTDGTTGYEVMNALSALQHDPAGEASLTRLWQDISGRPADFDDEERPARREILTQAFAGQHGALARAFHLAAQRERPALDLSEESCRRALAALLAVFPVYRTYATRAGAGPNDTAVVETARAQALEGLPATDAPALDFICATLLLPTYDTAAQSDSAIGFQKLSAPLTAKAVEDTGFYRYGRLLSRNDVGFDIRRFAGPVEDFHDFCQMRAAETPRALSATATHDHKRGEDLRARLAVLSELPGEWEAAVHHWRAINADVRPPLLAPDDEYQLYQTIAGAWPLDLAADDAEALTQFAARLKRWQEKALREAKLRSSWAMADADYEAATKGFIDRLFEPRSSRDFLASMAGFVDAIAAAGALNGLTQTFLRCLMPGTPDLYQGCELWDFSLVDPDNRSDVDYRKRAASLSTRTASSLLLKWRDGAIKQSIIATALGTRHRLARLFADGSYEPLTVIGPRAASVIAFVRRQDSAAVIVVAARHCGRQLLGKHSPLPGQDFWRGTQIHLPDSLTKRAASSLFEGIDSVPLKEPIDVARLLRAMPLGLLLID
jgi:(1->4)-alpha-D-glucan 1-alpha-D-glucosylmutase